MNTAAALRSKTPPLATIGGWLRGVLCCISIVVFAWYSAALVLRTSWPELDDPATIEDTGAGDRIPESARGSRARQSFAPIFGVNTVPTTAAKVAPVARNTAYSLRGLFEAPDGRSVALVESSGVTAVYREQDRLPGGEAVAEIGTDSVTLSGTSGFTLIAFEQSVVPGAVLAEAPTSANRAPKAVSDRATAVYEVPADVKPEQRPPISHARLTERVLTPEAMAALSFARVSSGDGKVGLRIRSLPRDELTNAIGLHRGDIIVAVNGRLMDSPDTIGTLLETLPARSEFVIDLVRRDTPHRLVIPLTHG